MRHVRTADAFFDTGNLSSFLFFFSFQISIISLSINSLTRSEIISSIVLFFNSETFLMIVSPTSSSIPAARFNKYGDN